jgi:1-acyl-sn-glycerol-3-phosphate acyltransferase
MSQPDPQALSFPPAALERLRATADAYDPRGRQWPLLKAILWCYRTVCVRSVSVAGRRHIQPGPRILVSNHARVSDGFLLAFVYGHFHALVQAESFTLPVLGKLMARSGWIPVIPGQARQVLRRASEALQQGGTVLIYPEGRLSHGGEMVRGQTGAIRLAMQTGVPLQPVAVHVDERYGRTVHGNFYGRPTVGVWQVGGPAYIAIGEAWRPLAHLDRPPTIAEARQATDDMMTRLKSLLEEARSATG